jgi:O-antigen/teichoic acid export membrane protein
VKPKPSTAQRIIQNALLSSSSQALTFLVAIFLTPYLLIKLGTERFAIWSVTYVLVAALAALDLGLKVTLTRFVAASLAQKDFKKLSEVLSTAVGLSIAFDLLMGSVIILF